MNTEMRSVLCVVIEKGKKEIKNRLFVLSSSISTLFVSCGLKHNRLGQVCQLSPRPFVTEAFGFSLIKMLSHWFVFNKQATPSLIWA